MSIKKGDIVYTAEYSIGLFEVYDVQGDRIFTKPMGWCNKGNGERLAIESDFPDTQHYLYEKFLLQNKLNENNYEIY